MILGPYLEFPDHTPIPENMVFATETRLVVENMRLGDYPELGRMFPAVVQLLFQKCSFPDDNEEEAGFWGLFSDRMQQVEFNYCQGNIRVPDQFAEITSIGVRGSPGVRCGRHSRFPKVDQVVLHQHSALLWAKFVTGKKLRTLELSGALPSPDKVVWGSLRALYLFDLSIPLDLSQLRCPELVTVHLHNCILTGRGPVGDWLGTCPQLRQASFTYIQAVLTDWVNFTPSGVHRHLRDLRIDQCRCEGSLGAFWWKFPRVEKLTVVWSEFRRVSPTPELGVLRHLRDFKWLSTKTVPDVRFAFGPALVHLDLGATLRRAVTKGIVHLLHEDRLVFLKLQGGGDTGEEGTTDDESCLARAVGRNRSLQAMMFKQARRGRVWVSVVRNSPHLQAVSFRDNYFTRTALLALLRLVTRKHNNITKLNLSTAREIRMPDVTSILARTRCVTNLSLRRWMFGRRSFLRLRHLVQHCDIYHIHVGAGLVYDQIRSSTARIFRKYLTFVALYLPVSLARAVLAYC
jgi:hypothetical protein